MGLNIGSIPIDDVKFGSSQVSVIYQGTDQVWPPVFVSDYGVADQLILPSGDQFDFGLKVSGAVENPGSFGKTGPGAGPNFNPAIFGNVAAFMNAASLVEYFRTDITAYAVITGTWGYNPTDNITVVANNIAGQFIAEQILNFSFQQLRITP